MPELVETMRLFRPLEITDSALLFEMCKRYFRCRHYPRFMLSPAYLLYEKHMYSIAEVDDCICIVKRKTISGNRIMYLLMPPLHKENDAEKERAVIERFRSLNISTKLCLEDMKLYDYKSPVDFNSKLSSEEYIYDAYAYISASGKSGKHVKTARNEGRKLQEAGRLKVDVQEHIDFQLADEMITLTELWSQQRSKGRTQRRLPSLYESLTQKHSGVYRFLTLRDCENRLIGFSVTERLSKGHVIIPQRLRDYDWSEHSDTSRYMHYLDCSQWSSELSLLNISMARDGGMKEHKLKLKPAHVLELFMLTTERKLTDEEYRSAVPSAHRQAQQTLF